jgi:hypothetical protein
MTHNQEKDKEKNLVLPEDFYKIIDDFVNDLSVTFPEYIGIISRWWKKKNYESVEDPEDRNTLIQANQIKCATFVFKHCMKVFPERFFDVLYKNVDIFASESELNTEFLPGIVFKQLWTDDISENTKEAIWKYLQLISFAVIGSVNDTSALGDTAKLFEAINEDELRSKLEETLEGMQGLFEGHEQGMGNMDLSNNFPNAEDLHNHIQGIMQGKLGQLAMELAEETANELNLDMENVGSAQDVFQKLFKNPAKLMNMVKNVGSKLDEKIKSGEIKESELISEGMEFLNKMKGMPGMENMEQMFSKMGIPGLGKGGKINIGAMGNKLNQNLKMAKMKERMKAKVDLKTQMEELKEKLVSQPAYTDDELAAIMSQPNTSTSTSIKSKAKKQKNKKN